MKKTEKLKLQIDNLPAIEITFVNLPELFLPVAEKLESEGNQSGPAFDTVLEEKSGESYFVSLNYVGKIVKPKQKLFGQDEKEFMKRQYK